ncbi:hypothetical protein EGR_09571 [Echinococcus granulosus]|uniref:Uncharacterized protein n=1 Tax=Echinococcus granulosus TaxID=6210 RepID=W6UQA6_ECHGR|nr:hypothetical protein EGR_09571 [Echinococcus granulosus]EUB55564.1 hypothetical protein EGR_09571 [Echinococcus granulosus]
MLKRCAFLPPFNFLSYRFFLILTNLEQIDEFIGKINARKIIKPCRKRGYCCNFNQTEIKQNLCVPELESLQKLAYLFHVLKLPKNEMSADRKLIPPQLLLYRFNHPFKKMREEARVSTAFEEKDLICRKGYEGFQLGIWELDPRVRELGNRNGVIKLVKNEMNLREKMHLAVCTRWKEVRKKARASQEITFTKSSLKAFLIKISKATQTAESRSFTVPKENTNCSHF